MVLDPDAKGINRDDLHHLGVKKCGVNTNASLERSVPVMHLAKRS